MGKLLPSLVLVLGSLFVIGCFLAVVIVDPKEEPNFSVFVGEYVPQVRSIINAMPAFRAAIASNTDLSPSLGNTTCEGHWGTAILTTAGSASTDPALVQRVLAAMLLKDYIPARVVLKDLLEQPQPLSSFVSEAAQCVRGNAQLHRFACEALTNADMQFDLVRERDLGRILREVLHVAIVTERLTAAMNSAVHFSIGVVKHVSEKFDDLRDNRLLGDEAYSDPFYLDKYDTVILSLKARNAVRLGVHVNPVLLELALQINILEATAHGSVHSRSNALAGTLLANYVSGKGTLVYSTLPEQGAQYHWSLGKEWADAYSSWNFAFVAGHSPRPLLAALQKLLIPIVSCQSFGSTQAEGFVQSRLYSLFLTVVLASQKDFPGQLASDIRNANMTEAMGKINLALNQLDIPTFEDLDTMFDRLESASKLLSQQEGYNTRHGISMVDYIPVKDLVYIEALTLWISVVLLGFGLEVFSSRYLIHRMNIETVHHTWIFAQMLFPLCLSLAVFSQSEWGLVFLVLGLWKLGFPEAFTSFSFAYNLYVRDGTLFNRRLIGKVLDGLGTTLHHTATSLMICALATGMQKIDNALSSALVPLVFQHWFASTKYLSFAAYCFAMTIIEVWWEVEVFTNMDKRPQVYMQYITWTMLVAHWLYFSSGLLNLWGMITESTPPAGSESTNEPVRKSDMDSFPLETLHEEPESDDRESSAKHEHPRQSHPEGEDYMNPTERQRSRSSRPPSSLSVDSASSHISNMPSAKRPGRMDTVRFMVDHSGNDLV